MMGLRTVGAEEPFEEHAPAADQVKLSVVWQVVAPGFRDGMSAVRMQLSVLC
jgi:hypothetical protein